MNNPLVSVVIPFYSEKKWLEEALLSVINQTYSELEILVINDGSTEKIDDLIKKFPTVNFIFKENGGPASARNVGIKKSKGKYIAFLDSDDIWLPEKLNKQITFMEKNNSVWSQHSYSKFYNESSKGIDIVDTHIIDGNVYTCFFTTFKAQTSCFVIRKDVILKHNWSFPEEKRFGQDIFFFMEIAKKYSIDYVEGNLALFRIRDNNAGFRADVQLNHKSSLLEMIDSDKKLQKLLPINVKVGYRVAYLNNKIANLIGANKIKNSAIKNIVYGIFYLFPYIIIKISPQSNKKRSRKFQV